MNDDPTGIDDAINDIAESQLDRPASWRDIYDCKRPMQHYRTTRDLAQAAGYRWFCHNERIYNLNMVGVCDSSGISCRDVPGLNIPDDVVPGGVVLVVLKSRQRVVGFWLLQNTRGGINISPMNEREGAYGPSTHIANKDIESITALFPRSQTLAHIDGLIPEGKPCSSD